MLKSSDLVGLYRSLGGNVNLAPLGGYERIELGWEEDNGDKPIMTLMIGDREEDLRGDDAKEWVNKVVMKHLQNNFSPEIDVLNMPFKTIKVDINVNTGQLEVKYEDRSGKFALDMKDFYYTGTFHGTANYQLERPPARSDPEDTGLKTKMRSYEKKKGTQRALVMEHGELAISDRYDEHSPAELFLGSLRNSDAIERPVLYAKTEILKTKEYAHKIKRFENSELAPGDNIVRLQFIKEFSLTQFTFQTIKQYKSIKKQFEQLREKYGQSYERHFLNTDGTLRYQEMIETIDRLIFEGVTNIDQELDKNRHINRNLESRGLSVNAPGFDAWKQARVMIDKGMVTEDEVITSGDNDFYGDNDWED